MEDFSFSDAQLILAHGSFPYDPQPSDPSRSRMDSAHRCAVAFLFRRYGARKDALAHVLFSGGALQLTGKIRQDFPKGQSAAWAGPFLTAVRRLGAGASFTRYRAGESLICTMHRLVMPGSVCLALDSDGEKMEMLTAPPQASLELRPMAVTFVVGGPRGYPPSTFGALSASLRDVTGRNFCALLLPGPQQFASSGISFLQISNEENALRPAVSQIFYRQHEESADFEQV